MSDDQSAGLRIGDAEREQAVQALGEHMSTGRLDIEEYGDRSAKVTAAKTRGDLAALFTDLPEPRPAFGAPRPAQPVPAQQPQTAEVAQRPSGKAQRIAGSVMPVVTIAALALFFATGLWWMFLAIPLAGAVLGAIFGDDFRHDWHGHHRNHYRVERDEMRAQRRAMRRGRW